MVFAPFSDTSQRIISATIADFEDRRTRRLGCRMASELVTVEPSWENDLISAIVPIYGDVNPLRVETCLTSLRRQRDVNLEIILVEQTFDIPRFRSLADRGTARYAVDQVQEAFGTQHHNSGRVRNVGIAASRGEFIHISDADILYSDPWYFAKLVQLMRTSEDLVLVWPRMQHLVLEGQEAFCLRYLAQADWATQMDYIHPLGEWAWQFNQELVDSPGPAIAFLNVTHHGKRYIVRQEDFARYTREREYLDGWEPLFWLSCRHDGAITARRKQIDIVAGYSESYYQWGEEDSDLQWKLSEVFCLLGLENIPEFGVLHLDHERKWFDKLLFERNKLIAVRRKERGILGTIMTDVLENRSLYGQNLRQRWRIKVSGH